MYGDVCGLQGPERCCRHRRHEQAGEPGTAVHTGATACVRTSRCMEEICSVSRGRSIIQPRCWVALVPLAEWLAAFELMLFAASVWFSFPVKKKIQAGVGHLTYNYRVLYFQTYLWLLLPDLPSFLFFLTQGYFCQNVVNKLGNFLKSTLLFVKYFL